MKGQTALEYLITYGWAILVILVVLAVLWYYGIFNPAKWSEGYSTCANTTNYNVSNCLDLSRGLMKCTYNKQSCECSFNQNQLEVYNCRQIILPNS